MTEVGVEVFDPVRQVPYLGLSDRGFFRFFFLLFLSETSMAIPKSHRRFFFTPFLTWDVSDHITDPVCETGVCSLTSQSEISFLKKTGLTDRGMATDVLFQNDVEKKWKKPGLWDRGVATGGPGQKPDRKKMTWSVRQSYGFCWVNKINRTQLAMECSISGTKLKDRVRNSKVRDLTGTKNIKYVIKKLKLKYVGHIRRNKENRWERRVLEWTPYGNKRKKGRPKKRWEEEIIRMGETTWDKGLCPKMGS